MRSVLAIGLTLVATAACGGTSEPPPPNGVISLSVGQSRTVAATDASPLEVSGGSTGGEFVLIAFYGSQTASSTLPLQFTGTQVTAASGPPSPSVAPTSGGLFARATTVNPVKEDTRFHLGLRRLERGPLRARMADARAVYARRAAERASRSTRGGPSFSVAAAVPAVGDQLSFNVSRALGTRVGTNCEGTDFRTGTVVAVTDRAVVVVDNANPRGGFTAADYAGFAQEFDSDVYPVVTQNFGTPVDIDQNGGRSIIFYTRAVNELSPAGSDEIIGGYFHPRDIFPKNATPPEQGYCGSNEAEMFYMLVPDLDGVVNNNKRDTADVRRTTVGVLAHEFQHLVNGSRRLYVNDAFEFEDTWLNEGLSHIAEELLFYRASQLAPRQNITITRLRSSATILTAANKYQVANMSRLIEYLKNPEGQSPYAEEDALATRGAAWQLLRYAADRSSTAEQTLWFNLANSRNAGAQNFSAAFGGTFVNMVRDWATAGYTDDAVSQTTAALQQPSWHYRSVVPVLLSNANPPPYPLRTRPLPVGTPLSVTLNGGGAAYLRFGVPANTTAEINVTSSVALTAATSFTVVRTK